jgi:hypothetical protein
MPVLAGRPGSVALPAQAAMAAGVVGCLAMAVATVERYPQMMSMGTGGAWPEGVVFNVVSAGYLGAAWQLPRWFPATRRNSLYALAAGLVMAAVAAQYIARPSLMGLWEGPLPGGYPYLLAWLALPAAAALSSGRRGRLEDGLETAVWAALLAGLTTSIMMIAATFRVASAAGGSARIVADAHLHGVASASVWLASDNLGGAIFSGLILMPVVFLVLAAAGAIGGRALRVVMVRAWCRPAR